MPSSVSVTAKFRAPAAAVARWRMASVACGLTLSAWLREHADHAAAGRTDPRAVAAELAALRREINAVGANLNQVVRHANSAAQAGQTAEAIALRTAVEAARSAVEAAAGTIRDAMRGGIP